MNEAGGEKPPIKQEDIPELNVVTSLENLPYDESEEGERQEAITRHPSNPRKTEQD